MKLRSITLAILLVIIFGLALANGLHLMFRLAYVIGLVLFVSYGWAWLSLRGIETSLEGMPHRAEVGSAVKQEMKARSRGFFPRLWLEVCLETDMPGVEPRIIMDISSREPRWWQVEIQCSQRGYFSIGPARITSSDPLGLYRLQVSQGRPHSLLVYPATIPLPYFHLPMATLTGEGRLRRRTSAITPNASSVRDYTHDDSFNRIHWPSSAHTGKLMVKEFDQDPSSDIWLVLDMQQKVQAGSGPDSTEEYAVTIAASIAKKYLQIDRNVGLLAVGPQLIHIEAQRGGAHLWRIMEALALVRARGDVSLGDLLTMEGRRFGRHTTLAIITPSPDEAWHEELAHLDRRGVASAVILLDAASFGGEQATAALPGPDGAFPVFTLRKGDDPSQALTSAPDMEPRKWAVLPRP